MVHDHVEPEVELLPVVRPECFSQHAWDWLLKVSSPEKIQDILKHIQNDPTAHDCQRIGRLDGVALRLACWQPQRCSMQSVQHTLMVPAGACSCRDKHREE
jgi:hypothetical protein